MAVIHSSYYAMFHAARAVLFQAAGRAPKRHDSVIQQFGRLVSGRNDTLRSARNAFNERRGSACANPAQNVATPSPHPTATAGQLCRDTLRQQRPDRRPAQTGNPQAVPFVMRQPKMDKARRLVPVYDQVPDLLREVTIASVSKDPGVLS